MKTLYEAASLVEAHLLKDLLAQEGVPAVIHGEFLQGGMGELPAAGLIRLMVDDHHYGAGRAVIERWEASPVSDIPDVPRPPARGEASPAGGQSVHRQPHPPPQRRRDGRNPFGMWIAVAVVATACWLYARAVEAIEVVDVVDIDGRIDGRAKNADRQHPAPPPTPGDGAALRLR
ncbi:DUF2007 domain-containing protein [Methyloversatilis sp. XJ19-13]|uniref:putative signal transducing protein n=1 Tax=Methyloversatilis sp. XJ19-13 TaxID=2963430 RepID=UPI00211C16D5|nr:DUF2007 domain-containing protein [Methyloversatilis sp. XJ19-13]MCQ9374083.1 DUF2007 domain-containing protein [Methyloversatilis sp. XJ19-13]